MMHLLLQLYGVGDAGFGVFLLAGLWRESDAIAAASRRAVPPLALLPDAIVALFVACAMVVAWVVGTLFWPWVAWQRWRS